MPAISVAVRCEEVALEEGRLFLDGRWVDASDGGTWTHLHPSTGEEVGRFAVATPDDVDLAVRAARRSFDEGAWPRMSAKDRKAILSRVVELIRERVKAGMDRARRQGRHIGRPRVTDKRGFQTRYGAVFELDRRLPGLQKCFAERGCFATGAKIRC
jgi:hypothetical protein